MKKSKLVVAYIPVLHRGYMDFLKESGTKDVFLLEASDVPDLTRFAREIRALRFEETAKILECFGYNVRRFSRAVSTLEKSTEDLVLIMPDEDISRVVYSRHFEGAEVTFVTTFLRWDWNKSVGFTPAIPDADRIIRKGSPEAEEISRYMRILAQEQTKSSDWWRQVAAMARCKNGEVLLGYNNHLPHEHAPYFDGDPRNNFLPGEHVDLYTSIHGETVVITEAAKTGISLEGADLYVTTFPCAICASQISLSGIRRVFFTGGYSNLNGVKDLRDHGVELIYVET